MKSKLLLLICLPLPACANLSAAWEGISTGRIAHRPLRASEEEAAQFKFPLDLPAQARATISGVTATAIQLAMDDFLPWDTKPHPGASPDEVCLYKHESYDVDAAPGPEGLMFVRFFVKPGVCSMGGPPVLDMGATYAIDVRAWRILAIQRP